MKAAFGTEGDGGGCWRWWGNIIIPAHEWVHTAVSYDGTTEHHFVSGVQVRQAAILGKVRQARLLTEQDRLVGTCDGPIDLVVAHLSIEDAQIRFTIRWRFGQIGGRSVVGG